MEKVKLKILIVGYGVVGRHTAKLLTPLTQSIDIYDPPLGYKPKQLNYDIAIYCTNVKRVEDLLNILPLHRVRHRVIRSTITPSIWNAICSVFGEVSTYYWPEFLKQKEPEESTKGFAQMMSVGCPIGQLFEKVRLGPTMALVLAKLYQNTYYATRVHHSNIFHRWARDLEVPYEMVRTLAHLLPVQAGDMVEQGSLVPGPDGKIGFGGVCIPKDTLLTMADLFDKEDSKWLADMLSKNLLERGTIHV